MQLNASDDRGIRVVRDQIKSFAGTRNVFAGCVQHAALWSLTTIVRDHHHDEWLVMCLGRNEVKLIILDEADAMTNDAQFALRRVIERNTRFARFCLICNYASKIIPALQSRCTRFRFAPLRRSQVEDRVRTIIAKEKCVDNASPFLCGFAVLCCLHPQTGMVVAMVRRISATEDGIKAVIRLSGGDMRKVLNVLQATSVAYDEVNERNVYLCTGDPAPSDIHTAITSLLNDSFSDAFSRACASR